MTGDEEVAIHKAIAAYVAGYDSSACSSDLRQLATALDALPVYADIGGALLIRPSGQVLLVESDQPWGAGSKYRFVEEGPWRMLALVSAARRFPSLSFLRPRRPDTALQCRGCGGLGSSSLAGGEVVCAGCQGLGWLSNEAT